MSRQGQQREKNYDNIKEFWESEAAEWGDSPQVTIRDHFFRNHELQTLLSVVPRCKRLLDVGCGTGFGTLILSQRAEYGVGVDYSESMIEWAIRARDDRKYRTHQAHKYKLPYAMEVGAYHQVDFRVADILKLDLELKDFEVVTGQRILINLPTHGDQMIALEQLRRHCSDESCLFLTEPTLEGHSQTDRYREQFGLPILEKYWHNNYVNESRYDEWIEHGWRVVHTLSFETYMLLSKVIYPAAVGPQNCEFLSGANEAACEIANVFRTRTSATEIGIPSMLEIYAERTEQYNASEGKAIRQWIEKHCGSLPNWEKLGHQQLIVAKACGTKRV
ncbi:MAG: class I SAM-dependent methyltransferase [Planctomycetota bacterium]|jgi:SAM-dependent methyltransferase